MKKISAEIVADSISPQGHRITSYILTYPRFIHSELMTHRMFSRNSASSRAIPFNKMVKMVEEDPFIPIAWQKDHKGMQGTEYLDEKEAVFAEEKWLSACHNAINSAKMLNNNYFGVQKNLVTKQLCNRLLEPFMWHTVLVTATEYDNFFELRCPKYHNIISGTDFRSRKDWIKHYLDNGGANTSLSPDNEKYWRSINISQAEIHIQALAETMWDAMNESTPTQLKEGEWHLPFGDRLNKKEIDKFAWIENKKRNLSPTETERAIATARCARLSYMTFDNEIDYLKDIALHDQLFESKHMSPFEHCARAMTTAEHYQFRKGLLLNTDEAIKNTAGWCNNFKGFISYRYLIENE